MATMTEADRIRMDANEQNKVSVTLLLQQISFWEHVIDNDLLKKVAATTAESINRNESIMAILPHFNSLNAIDKAQNALVAKSKLLYAVANVIDAIREAKKMGVDIDSDLALVYHNQNSTENATAKE